jgi:hypothetical protein
MLRAANFRRLSALAVSQAKAETDKILRFGVAHVVKVEPVHPLEAARPLTEAAGRAARAVVTAPKLDAHTIKAVLALVQPGKPITVLMTAEAASQLATLTQGRAGVQPAAQIESSSKSDNSEAAEALANSFAPLVPASSMPTASLGSLLVARGHTEQVTLTNGPIGYIQAASDAPAATGTVPKNLPGEGSPSADSYDEGLAGLPPGSALRRVRRREQLLHPPVKSIAAGEKPLSLGATERKLLDLISADDVAGFKAEVAANPDVKLAGVQHPSHGASLLHLFVVSASAEDARVAEDLVSILTDRGCDVNVRAGMPAPLV